MERNHQLAVVLFVVLILASVFRVWQLDIIPPGLYPDEAMNANDAIQTLQTQDPQTFYPENNGREGLFVWLISLSFYLFGSSVFALRLTSAIIGILTVLGLYLLINEVLYFIPKHRITIPGYRKILYQVRIETRKIIAILGSFLLAISFWHINFSRIGFRGILVPFIMCFAFYFLIKAFRTKRIFDYISAGVIFGLGFYTYIAFRVAVLIAAILIILKFIEYWQKTKILKQNRFSVWIKKMYLQDGWWKTDLFIIIVILTALPIGIYFLNNFDDFTGRASGVSVFSQENPIYALGVSTVKTLGMFNIAGDNNWRHNLPNQPMLFWPVGIFFLIGFALVIENIITSYFQSRLKRFSQIKIMPVYSWFLISWFFIMLLPAILTTEGIPHALRTIGVIPVVYIFAAIGLYWLMEKIYGIPNKSSNFLALLLLVTFFALSPVAVFDKYFLEWGHNPHTAGAFREDLTGLNQYIQKTTYPQKYIIVNESGVPVPYPNGIPMPAQSLVFYNKTNNLNLNFIKPENINQINPYQKNTIIIPLKPDHSLFQQISKIWPQGQIKQITNKFKAYEINQKNY